MIQANELRVGNWVNNYGQYCFVLEIYKTNKVELGYFKDSIGFIRKLDDVGIKPIPITEDILLKCGFYKDEDINYRYYFDFDWAVILAYDIDDNCIRIGDSWDFSKVIYIHDLQNLYFALTKTELIINL